MNPPKLLVIMPVFNADPYLHEAINSILVQSFCDFTFLIIDDGSSDRSTEIVRSYHDGRILFWKQVNSGPGMAMNRAMQYALDQGIPFLARMDADDISNPIRLENQLALLEAHPEAAACSANCYYIDSETSKIIGTSTVSTSPRLIRWEIFMGLRGLIQGACIFRVKALHASGGYRTAFRQSEETDVFLHLAESFQMINSSDFLYKIRVNSKSLSMGDVHGNTLHHFYALDCSAQRRKGLPEREFKQFQDTLTPSMRYRIWREEKVLELWRGSFGRKKIFRTILAALLDPRRVLVRLARKVLG